MAGWIPKAGEAEFFKTSFMQRAGLSGRAADDMQPPRRFAATTEAIARAGAETPHTTASSRRRAALEKPAALKKTGWQQELLGNALQKGSCKIRPYM